MAYTMTKALTGFEGSARPFASRTSSVDPFAQRDDGRDREMKPV